MFSLNSIVGIDKPIVYRNLDNGRFMSKVEAGKRIKHAVDNALHEKFAVNAAFVDQHLSVARTAKSAEESAKVFMEHFPPKPAATGKFAKTLRKAGKIGLVLAGAAALFTGGIALYNIITNSHIKPQKVKESDLEKHYVEEIPANNTPGVAAVHSQAVEEVTEENPVVTEKTDKKEVIATEDDKSPKDLLEEAITLLDEALGRVNKD